MPTSELPKFPRLE